MHEVQALMVRTVPGLTSAFTDWMFGFQRRWVRRCECDTFIPKPGPLPQTSHTAAIVKPLEIDLRVPVHVAGSPAILRIGSTSGQPTGQPTVARARRAQNATMLSQVGRAGTGDPIRLDDVLVDRWFAQLARASRAVPGLLLDQWRRMVIAAVSDAREPAPAGVSGRFAVPGRYLTGIAAAVAASRAAGVGSGMPTPSEATDAVVLAAGLLAGSAALAAADTTRSEVAVAASVATAVVDVAAAGAPLGKLIAEAARRARMSLGPTWVSEVILALGRAASADDSSGEPVGTPYRVALAVEPAEPGLELDVFAIDTVLSELTRTADWIPTPTGYRLILSTTEPGPLIESLLRFGQISELQVAVSAREPRYQEPP